MSNPLGRFLNRDVDAQNFTEQINDATEVEVREEPVKMDGSIVDENSVFNGDTSGVESLADPARDVAMGVAALRGARDDDLAKRVMSDFAPADVSSGRATANPGGREDFGLSLEEPDFSGTQEDFASDMLPSEAVTSLEVVSEDFASDTPSPEVVSEEFAHERKLASDEGDRLETNPEVLYEALSEAREVNGDQLAVDDEVREFERGEIDDFSGAKQVMEQSVERGADQNVSSAVNEKFVGGERELTRNTMHQVENIIAHRGDVPIVELLKVYEMGANAVRQDDERVG